LFSISLTIAYENIQTNTCPLVDKIVTTHGIVTAVDDESFYMQDGQGEWNGIFVYQSGNNPLIGDQINIEALVEEYFGLTELKSVVNFEIISNGNTITPDMIDVPQANSEDWEGSFVQVENVSCTEAPDQYGAWIVELEFSIKK
jgi:predicted extracellular nuclease